MEAVERKDIVSEMTADAAMTVFKDMPSERLIGTTHVYVSNDNIAIALADAIGKMCAESRANEKSEDLYPTDEVAERFY